MTKITLHVRNLLLILFFAGSVLTLNAKDYTSEFSSFKIGNTTLMEFSKDSYNFNQRLSSKLNTYALGKDISEKISRLKDNFTPIFSSSNNSKQDFALEISVASKNPTCIDSSDGSIEIDISNGISPYTYSWSGPGVNGTTSKNLTNLAEGSYTVSVSDSNSDTSTKTITLIHEDNVKPQILVKDFTLYLNSNGQGKLSTGDIDNGSADNCGIAKLSLSKTDFTCANLGSNTVTLTVTDVNNNFATKNAIVTVKEEIAPTAIAQNITVDLDASGNASITAAQIDNGSKDNCSVVSISLDKTNFNCSNIGSNPVVLSVTDSSNNKSTATATVTVQDVTAPQVIIKNITVQLDASGNATIAEDAVNNNSNDTCGTLSFDTDITSFDCTNVGANTVKLTATDGNGNSAVKTAIVTVEDKIAPIVITKPITVQLDANGQVSISPADVNNGSSDNCGIDNFILNKTSFSCSEVGENTVILEVIDINGNTSTGSAVVTVEDKEIPIIAAVSPISKNNDLGLCRTNISITPPTASDNCSLNVVIGSRKDNLALNEPYPVGTTLITWNVSDEHGNNAESVIQEIIVIDNEAPVPPELEDIIWGCEYTIQTPVSIDNCGTEITGTPSRSTTFTTSGDIIWTFIDSDGNTATATQKVTINPLQLNETNITVSDVLCNGLATGEAEAAATGGVAPLKYDWGSLGIGAKKTNLPAGTYNVKVSDANGCEVGPVSVTIKEPDTFIEITSTTSTSGCFGANNGTATVQAIGGIPPYSYLWNDSEAQTSQKAENLAPGNHTVTVTDANGCSKDRTVTVSQPTELKITGFLTTETTSFGSATGTATVQVTGGSGGYTFLWSDPNKQTGQTATSLLAGKYTVTVKDSNGCTTTGEAEVVNSLYANIIPVSLCKNDEIIRTSTFSIENGSALGGTAPYSYSWNFGENASPATSSNIEPIDVKYSSIGDKLIILTVTDAKGRKFEQRLIQYVGGCFSDDCGSSDLGIDDYYIGDENGVPINSNNCSTANSKFIYINIPTNPDRYSLNVELIYSIENITTGEIQNLKEVGCFYQKSTIPDRAKTFQIAYTCGNIVKIEGIFLTFQNNKNNKCGTTKGNGNNPKCYSTNNEATVSSPLFGVAFPNELLCNGSNNGNINARASGGSGTYIYKLISTPSGIPVGIPQASNQFNELPGGTYKVIINDGENTFTTAEVEVKQPSSALVFDVPTITNVVCFGGENGTATVNATGGTPNSTGDKYIYVWSNGQTGPTATNLIAGNYTVTVTDANGCKVEKVITIEQPDELLANAGPDQVLGCGTNSTNLAAIFVTDTTATQEQSGTWTIVNGPNGGSFADENDPKTLFSGNQGTYTLRWSVTCGKTDDVKITFQSCSTLDFDGQDDHINLGDNYGLNSNDFTLEAWIKPKSTDGVRTIMSKRDYSNLSAGGYDFVINNGIPQFRYGSQTFKASNAVNTSRWFHIAVIKNNSEIKFLVDGIALDSVTGASNPAVSNAPMLIGAIYNASTPNITKNQFHGWIEELRIWNKSLTIEQLHFMMNQRIKNDGNVKGEIIPTNVPGDLKWTSLDGYYRLIVSEITGGITEDRANNKISGKLVNITTSQQNTAPLPYESLKNGSWRTKNTWLRPDVWDVPNANGINNAAINWNIVKTKHTIYSNSTAISILGLLSETGNLTMEGSTSNGTGKGLTVTHYLKLDGNIDLQGESQLVQTGIGFEGQTISSKLDETSSGFIERDQQGTANSFNYNYWTSPVSLQGAANNSGYTIKQVMLNGTDPSNPIPMNFVSGPYGADDTAVNITNYWLYKFRGTANTYSQWKYVGENGSLLTGEGFTMKGTSGDKEIADRQNYTFKGKPNNGDFSLNIDKNQNYLLGNPYPSALDARKFILDNIKDSGGNNPNGNIFNGALYFWDHFSGKTHNLAEYVGGYATYNLSGGVRAISNDERILNNDKEGDKKPGPFIPVAQGFFINTTLDAGLSETVTIEGGNVVFNNGQRAFVKESEANSQFLSQEKPRTKGEDKEVDTRSKIRLAYESPLGFNRQILVTADENATNDFDLGYDAPLNDNNSEDMFWIIKDHEFVIQGVPDFNIDQELPLGIKLKDKGELTIKIDALEHIKDDVEIYLKNMADSTYHDLRAAEYMTTLEGGTYNNKYVLVFQKPKNSDPNTDEETDEETDTDTTEGTDEGTDENPTDNPTLIEGEIDVMYAMDENSLRVLNPSEIMVEKVELYNMLGQRLQVYDSMSEENSFDVPLRDYPKATYIVKVKSINGTVSKTILFKR